MKRFKKLAALVATTLLTASLFVGCGSSNVGENGTIAIKKGGECYYKTINGEKILASKKQ